MTHAYCPLYGTRMIVPSKTHLAGTSTLYRPKAVTYVHLSAADAAMDLVWTVIAPSV